MKGSAFTRTATTAIFAGGLLASGCSALGLDDDGAASSGKPQVVAAFYPFAFVTGRVAGDAADVVNLTSPGVEPHDLELTPQQVATVSEADLVVYEEGFQPAVDDAVDQNASGATLQVTDVVPLVDTGAADDHDHGDGAEGHADDEGTDHTRETLAGDPHLWQDPTLMAQVADQVATDLAELDPDHADDYRANADALVDDLDVLDTEFRTGLADCTRTEFVTSHASFGYLARRYDLTMVPIAGLSPGIEPSPEKLAKIQDHVAENGITTVFSETLGSSEYADVLADDLGVDAAVLDPIEGLTDDDSDDDYFTLMRANLRALQQANGCR